KFTRIARRKNMIPKKQNKPPKCFECGEIGHIKPNCPKLQKGEKDKKLKKKQKAYISWENEDDSSTDSDDEEVANIFLMANEEKVSDLELCEDDLQESYDNLLEEFIKISQDFTTTKKLNAKLQKENDGLKNENTKLGKIKINPNDNVPCESCEKHIHEIEKLKSSLSKFNESSKNLDKILGKIRKVLDILTNLVLRKTKLEILRNLLDNHKLIELINLIGNYLNMHHLEIQIKLHIDNQLGNLIDKCLRCIILMSLVIIATR
ncbi:hypothetical protein PIB30_103531, partial [Stylosanthes scabra]|nr:hypothetical protein [Stylosanthes scabra]